VSISSDKLQLLARQARTLALQTSDRKRSAALRALAVLYTRQAEEITESELLHSPVEPA